ncbi:glycerate kinase [Bifidobacterium breve]|uniref:glycerate kinase n=1 Tax=Bifidobacterium breve TaxID=1685 RepID=UPI00097E4062|nr:glycerate kinase [Bifidobacterium breve]AQM43307.1 glycerate 2-kinase [Bifidobacterium breve]AZI16864.1 glycerate kinase [Bifidobacterium breve]
MKFVIAPDSFKGCMTAKQACAAIRDGLLRVFPDAEYVMVPMADGGEGTVRSLVDATHGRICSAQVLDPLQRETVAEYGILGNANDSGLTAIIEMSAASGIQFVDEHTRNPLVATTYGTGQLMKHALDDGVRTIILGVGGSATNDGGAGMAEALGVRFLDEHGNPIPRGGGFLDRLATVDVSGLDPRIANTCILIASDVTNPLVGPIGASAVFGPQKGATPRMVAQLDSNLAHYATVIQTQLGIEVAHAPGTGGAGGLGAGLLAFTQSTMRAGVEIVSSIVRLAELAEGADYCFTGEGGIDFQTKYGKTPMGVAKAVRERNSDIGVIAFAGNVGEGIDQLYDVGIDAVFGIVSGAMSLDKAIAAGPENLSRAAENVGRLIRIGQR